MWPLTITRYSLQLFPIEQPKPLNVIFMTAEITLLSTDEWAGFVGAQFRSMRIDADMDRELLAERAGVSIGAIKNLEKGRCSLVTMIKVCRALGRTDWLTALAPQVSISPMMILKSRQREVVRQRASPSKKRRAEEA